MPESADVGAGSIGLGSIRPIFSFLASIFRPEPGLCIEADVSFCRQAYPRQLCTSLRALSCRPRNLAYLSQTESRERQERRPFHSTTVALQHQARFRGRQAGASLPGAVVGQICCWGYACLQNETSTSMQCPETQIGICSWAQNRCHSRFQDS